MAQNTTKDGTMSTHRTEVNEPGFITPQPSCHRASCECGWESLAFDNRRDALNEADEHALAMARAEEDGPYALSVDEMRATARELEHGGRWTR